MSENSEKCQSQCLQIGYFVQLTAQRLNLQGNKQRKAETPHPIVKKTIT